MNRKYTKLSKFLSYVLRHRPDVIGLELDNEGWASVDELINGAQKKGKRFNHEKLIEIVETNDKKRYTLSQDGSRIRANQGHSLKVDLKLNPVKPPDKLYHGTATKYKKAISTEGLKAKKRHHVHLSKDIQTAKKVGQRHGKPVILEIDAIRMHREGVKFYCSENDVWLTDHVAPDYFEVIE